MHIVDFFSWKFFFSLNIMCGSRNIYAPIVIRRLCSKVWEHKIITLFLMRGHQSVKSVRIRSFLVCIFPQPDWTWRDTEYLSDVFSLNAAKYGPEKLQIRTLFTQCIFHITVFTTFSWLILKYQHVTQSFLFFKKKFV